MSIIFKIFFIFYLISVIWVQTTLCECSGCSQSRKKVKNDNMEDEIKEESLDSDYEDVLKVSDMVYFKGGEFYIGTETPIYEVEAEGPLTLVKIDSFWYDTKLVTNADFEKFVTINDYKTDAEIFGDSFIVTTFLSEEVFSGLTQVVKGTEWWAPLNDTNWRHPLGIDTDITKIMDHPVIHVSHRDADQYCKWVNKRLPTEAEFEYVCKDGNKDTLFPWGNEEYPNDEHVMNIWHGPFPANNTAADGYNTTNPVDKFRQTKSGVYDIIGNVWEWSSDWWGKGPKKGKDKLKKGGSYMCTTAYCYRYRCAARSHNTPDTSAGNIGFRCASSSSPVQNSKEKDEL